MSKRTSTFKSGTDAIDITAPGGIARLIEFHRATFGDARMEADGDGGSGDGTENQNQQGQENGEHGFPANTPVADMAPEQQAAYWKHQARKHEDRSKATADYDQIKAERDKLKTDSLSDQERAIEDAKRQGAEQARRESAPPLVRAEIKAALAGRIPGEQIAGHVEYLDTSKFLTAEGEVDAAKVSAFAAGIAPVGGQQKWPDMGGGQRGQAGKGVASVESGRDLWAERHNKNK